MKINTHRGDTIAAKNASKFVCDNGHSLEDAYIHEDGTRRRCRICKRLQHKKYQQTPQRKAYNARLQRERRTRQKGAT